MKIAIIGPWSIPWQIKKQDIFDPDEKIIKTTNHTHPWIYNLAVGLSSNHNNEVHVIMFCSNIKNDKNILFQKIYFHIINIKYKKLQVLFNSSPMWRKINNLIKEINPDIIHGQSRCVESYITLGLNYPNIITSHGQIVEEFRRTYPIIKPAIYYYNRMFEIMVNNKIKYSIGVSNNCTNNLKLKTNYDMVFLIENPIDLVYFNSKINNYNNDLLFIGGIIPLKRLYELICVVKNISNIKLKIISSGINRTYLKMIKQYIVNNDISDRIIFLGYQTPIEIVNLMKNSFALCLPSYYESFGMVLAEAMACGIPVIATNVGGPSSFVYNGINGFLIKPGDDNELENKIRILVNDKDLVKKMGNNAQRIAFSRWHPHIIAKQTIDAYKNVIKNREKNDSIN